MIPGSFPSDFRDIDPQNLQVREVYEKITGKERFDRQVYRIWQKRLYTTEVISYSQSLLVAGA